MVNMVSILIAAREEKHLEKTIRDVLSNARGEIEVIVVLDGWIPDPQIHLDKRVTFVTFYKSIGQRAAINEAARRAGGKYIMKLDAHCAVDEGFDVKLARDCEYDWTVVPRMYNLDEETWLPKKHKRTDYMYITSPTEEKPFRATYYGSRQPKNDKMIDDTMACVGCCWFMHKDRFFEQDGCDEGHEGGWGQQGVEVSLKAWLSGGSLKVNKGVWFAHLFRKQFPYPASGRQHERVRKYSRDLWLNNKWSGQKKPLSWLIEKFSPVPIKGKNMAKDIYGKGSRGKHQWGRIGSIIFPMDELINDILDYRDRRRPLERAVRRMKTMVPFIKKLIANETFTDEQLMQQPYYDALRYTHYTSKRKSLRLMRDLMKLVKNVKANGVHNPIDMWRSRGKLVLHRGWRRLLIMKELGYKKVPCRLFKSIDHFRMSVPDKNAPCDDSIHGAGMKQFVKLKEDATDKFWVHSYTTLYDKHIGPLRPTANKILEIGVFKGASLLLWRDCFPKATVYGVDKTAERFFPGLDKEERIKLLIGRQEDTTFLNNDVAPNGPFDIIIDDGWHHGGTNLITFNTLWNSLASKGWYVVEDIYAHYHPRYKERPFIDHLKKTIDDMSMKGAIRSMHFYYNICFIEKS